MKNFFLLLFFVIGCVKLTAQQVADTLYNPPITNPEYKTGQGSVVYIDEGHHNFHTKDGRYTAFSRVLGRDGYRVKSYQGPFEKSHLKTGKILVISNALNERNIGAWHVPTPSAFTSTEIETVQQWVSEGGSLFLIADHMPMAGAATDLAKAFGFEFTNGFVFNRNSQGPAFFDLKDTTLVESTITNGKSLKEKVRQIASFTGQAFKIPEDATSILRFKEDYVNVLPDTAWVFNEKTPSYPVKGWSQGAYKKHGAGKVVVFGEAAMFSAQIAGPNKIKMGMNNPVAPENYQLLLNIIHWLDGKLE